MRVPQLDMSLCPKVRRSPPTYRRPECRRSRTRLCGPLIVQGHGRSSRQGFPSSSAFITCGEAAKSPPGGGAAPGRRSRPERGGASPAEEDSPAASAGGPRRRGQRRTGRGPRRRQRPPRRAGGHRRRSRRRPTAKPNSTKFMFCENASWPKANFAKRKFCCSSSDPVQVTFPPPRGVKSMGGYYDTPPWVLCAL